MVSPDYRGWLLEEDFALKQAVSNIKVVDVNTTGPGRAVKVWYRMPEMELRTVSFPHIMIDFLGQRIAHEREHRGHVPFGTQPYTDNPADWSGQFPIPMDLDYQITTGARSAAHDRQMVGQLSFGPLFTRFGSLTCPSGTVRRLDVIQEAVNGDGVDSEGKRYFRKIWTVRVSAEIAPTFDVEQSRVAELILTIKNKETGSTVSSATIP